MIFLPKLRCPVTGQALRMANMQDRLHHSLPADAVALVTVDGVRVYPVVDGIPHLLPA